MQRLQAEVDGLRRAQRGRAVIEQAKGLLVGRLGCTPDEAFTHLSQISQRSNMRVAEVAAGLLGIAAPMPEPTAPVTDDEVFQPDRYVRRATTCTTESGEAAPAVSLLPEEITARYHLTCAALGSADDPTCLAELAWSEGLRQLGVTAVLFGVLEPDGAVRLVSTYGLPKGLASAWQRVPSNLNVAFLRAVRDGRPLWIDRKRAEELGFELLGAGDLRACLPLRDNNRTFGVASVLWAEGTPPEADSRAYVAAIAEACGRRLSQLLRQGGAAPVVSPAAHWVEAVLETLPGSFALLAPVRDDEGRVVDFRFDRCSPEAMDAAGRTAEQICGRRMLDLHPYATTNGIFQGYVQALETGEPFHLPPTATSVMTSHGRLPVVLSSRASRFGDGLLAHWRYHDDEQRMAAHLERLQRAADAGWSEWDFVTGETTWSAQTYRILYRDPARGPVKLSALPRYVAPEEAASLTAAIHRLTRAGEPFDVTLPLHRGGEASSVRIVADPVTAHDGRVVAVHAALHRIGTLPDGASEAPADEQPPRRASDPR
ncbi:ANTAR domain-containing protein [Pseudosporangium ferrugineum]|uniref:ANTAR domain-containing protein n=1 Tax=Pseudosporangium ferrugineum TaxID=439699 RepID=UPI001304FC95|nr:ANTAR domain-containing protein [Pseudosporangium ferrugineum]